MEYEYVYVYIYIYTILTGVFQATTQQGSARKKKHKFRVELTVVMFKMFPFFFSLSYPLSTGIFGVRPQPELS